MGDRAIIVVKNGRHIASCGVYLHWEGQEAQAWLIEAIPRMKKCDEDYSTARLIGFLDAKVKGNAGLGVIPPPKNIEDETLREYSHRDAGVIIYDCSTGEVQYIGGYIPEGKSTLPLPPE